MIVLENLTKSFRVGHGIKFIARDINAVFPARTSVAILGRNGAGKSTLLKIIGGTMDADYGRVLSTGRISWQIGFAGSFHPDLSGAQNTRFIARVYGVDTESLMQSVQDFAELGESFFMPFRTYSSGMKARFAFGVSMGIPFSYYLIDEVTAVGDASFRAKCASVLQERLEDAGAIVVSHSDSMLRKICSAGAVLENGVLSYYDDIEEAIAHHNRNMTGAVEITESGFKDRSAPKFLYEDGAAALQKGEIDKAVAQLEKAVLADPSRAKWRAALGSAYIEAGVIDRAIASYREASRLAPLDARYHLATGRLLSRDSNHEAAIPCFRLATALNPSAIQAWIGLGRSLSVLGQIDEARWILERALQLDPENMSAHQLLLRLARRSRDAVSVSRHAATILASNPKDISALMALGKRPV